jgi:hypothetical protein
MTSRYDCTALNWMTTPNSWQIPVAREMRETAANAPFAEHVSPIQMWEPFPQPSRRSKRPAAEVRHKILTKVAIDPDDTP